MNPNKPVPIAEAENITMQLVTPMLKLTRYQLMDDGQMHVDPTDTIKCLHLWQAVITALTMRMHSQTVLEYLMKIRSIDQVLLDNLINDIAVADDNIAFLEQELLKYGIKL